MKGHSADRLSPPETLVAAGSAALARGAWEEACAAFQVAPDHQETPEALEGLGMATWWLDDATTTFEARELNLPSRAAAAAHAAKHGLL